MNQILVPIEKFDSLNMNFQALEKNNTDPLKKDALINGTISKEVKLDTAEDISH